MTHDQARSATEGDAESGKHGDAQSGTDAAAGLLSRFTDPGPEYGPLPLWWWSGAPVTGERLREQMELLLAQGVHQAVVICLAPTGPMFGSLADDPPYLSPEWLELLDGACADAEELGFSLWMYDQIGFSGANFQGRLTAANPEFAGLGLFRTTADTDGSPAVVRPPAGHTALTAYATPLEGSATGQTVPVDVPLDSDGTARWTRGPVHLTLVHSGVSGFDYFGTEACAALLEQVHGTLERHVGKWFGRSIGGFFQDELPALPTWGRDFAATFAEAYGYDLAGRLAALWEGDDDASARVRHDYQEHRAALGVRAFFGPQRAYFERHGLICGFDQPSPAREGDPVGGVKVYGDYHVTHRGYGAPGSDHWGDAKVHSSMAHVNGEPRTWIEAFHSSGWGGTLEETYDWLSPFLRRGANLYDPHAVYYATPGGWWEWAPPSTCWRQPYWPDYHVFANAVARLCSVLTTGHHVCDTVLLSPTTTAQGYLTLDGPLAPARDAAALYHRLNGVGTWFAERRGVLESAGLDHDVLDETAVARATLGQDTFGTSLTVGTETYRTVLLPGPRALHASAAAALAGFARAGGRVVCVGRAPELFPGEDGNHNAGSGFTEAVAAGQILVVEDPEQVPATVARGEVRVEADVPFLLRRDGGTHVLALTAHDETTGTRAPIVSLGTDDWTTQDNFSWPEYWRQLHEDGYTYVPSDGRTASVRIEGPARAPRAQRWDPGTGERTELDVRPGEDGGWRLTVPFADGAVALVVFGEDLPAATRRPLGPPTGSVELTGPWRARAESTLDNRWGDLAAADRHGVLPVEVWRMEHREGGTGPWRQVTAGFGPFALLRQGDGAYEPVQWSLSRGIQDDPVHDYRLGPKGYVPEEFLDVREVPAGAEVSVRTHLTLPAGRARRWLAVGANTARRVLVEGADLPVEGDGYQTFSPLPQNLAGRTVRVDLVLTAHQDAPVRASFAVVRQPAAYLRPEWISAGPGGPPGRTVDLSRHLVLDRMPEDSTVQVGSDGACTVLLNGTEVGRQGDFNPYPGHREVRVHPYDLGALLRPGENTLTLRLTDPQGAETAAVLDSAPVGDGGLGLRSDGAWTAAVEGRRAPVSLRPTHLGRDPRFVCSWARPHPLPGAHWLEPAAAPGEVVEPLVPDLAPGPTREEWLRFTAPLGATALRVRTSLRTSVMIGGVVHVPDANGRVVLPAPAEAGTKVALRIDAVDGRRGGALLDGPVTAESAETETPLESWEDLGLRALGGAVHYRTTLTLPDGPPAGRAVLDLGAVRGTAEVTVNGVPCGTRVWGPWALEVTGALRGGVNNVEVVVRGTLAGYLDDASPTRAIAAGQVRTGLFGPVRLLTYEA